MKFTFLNLREFFLNVKKINFENLKLKKMIFEFMEFKENDFKIF